MVRFFPPNGCVLKDLRPGSMKIGFSMSDFVFLQIMRVGGAREPWLIAHKLPNIILGRTAGRIRKSLHIKKEVSKHRFHCKFLFKPPKTMPERCGRTIRRYTTQRRQKLTFPVNIRWKTLKIEICDQFLIEIHRFWSKIKNFHLI